MITPYSNEVEQSMKEFFNSLSEKDSRRYAAVEAQKLGRCGISYIAKVLGCSRTTIYAGQKELGALPEKKQDSRIRRKGAGRKGYEETHAALDEAFLAILKDDIAGDPMNEKVRWTQLTHDDMKQRLSAQFTIQVSSTVIKKLLKKHGFKRRKAQKKETMKKVAGRNDQFERIAELKALYQAAGNPVISMDTKKKEYWGNFYRDGKLYTTEAVTVNDHDFNSFASGVVIPHGIYDIQLNKAVINLGTRRDTGEFACDSFRLWWYAQGKQDYPQASSILLLCDGGGSNSCHQYLFKQDLQRLANEIGIEIRVAHYPAYCSKYNPIEHRLFPHVTRACQGVVFTNIERVKKLIARTKTKKGLQVFVNLIETIYETGRKVCEGFKNNMPIIFDCLLPKWNYRAIPQNT
jgi:transposase